MLTNLNILTQQLLIYSLVYFIEKPAISFNFTHIFTEGINLIEMTKE